MGKFRCASLASDGETRAPSISVKQSWGASVLVRLVDYVSFGENVVRVISCATPWIGIECSRYWQLLHTEVRWGSGSAACYQLPGSSRERFSTPLHRLYARPIRSHDGAGINYQDFCGVPRPPSFYWHNLPTFCSSCIVREIFLID